MRLELVEMVEEKTRNLERFENLVRENQDLKRENSDLKARLEAALKEKEEEKDEDDLF